MNGQELIMPPTTESAGQTRTHAWVSYVLIVSVICVLGLGAMFIRTDFAHRAEETKRSLDDLNSQIEMLRAGETDSVNLYDTHGTDELLQQLRGMPEIQSLKLDLTDVSDDGIDHIAFLPNLRTLVVCGGRPGIGDIGLTRLSHAGRLETLELVNTHVTNDGLSELRNFPNLHILKLYYEASRRECLTEDAFEYLRELQELQRLELGGGWASDAMVSDLKDALPHCEIVTSHTP
jgi:hypothetical protein